jgi:hypothetical protein
MTTMISNQTNQIEALSDAELDNVAGGSIGLSLLAIRNALHHPIGNAGFILSETKNVVVSEAKHVAKSIFSFF